MELLKHLREKYKTMPKSGWREYYEQEVPKHSTVEVADVLRDISIALRPSASIESEEKESLNELKKYILDHQLQGERKSSIEEINKIREKIKDAPQDIINPIKLKLDNVEKDVLSEENIPVQDKIAKITTSEKSIRKIDEEFEIEYKRRMLEEEVADRKHQRKAKKFDVFSQRDAMANFLGSILLIIITIALIFSLFSDVKQESLEIIKNAFLLLLGFFFGQGLKTSSNTEKK